MAPRLSPHRINFPRISAHYNRSLPRTPLALSDPSLLLYQVFSLATITRQHFRSPSQPFFPPTWTFDLLPEEAFSLKLNPPLLLHYKSHFELPLVLARNGLLRYEH